MIVCFFFFKQKTAYEMRISDWSSDVCSSDLVLRLLVDGLPLLGARRASHQLIFIVEQHVEEAVVPGAGRRRPRAFDAAGDGVVAHAAFIAALRSEEHTSELQSLMRISYAVFCLKKKNKYDSMQQTTKKH